MPSPSDGPFKRRMDPIGSLLTAAFGQASPPPLSCLLARVEWSGVGWGGKRNEVWIEFLPPALPGWVTWEMG